MTRWNPAVLTGLVLLLSGCRPGPVKPPDTTPLPAPEAVLNMVRKVSASRRSMRALARVTYFGEKGRVRLKSVIVAERPDRFRVETLSPLEQPIDVMVTDGKRLWLISKGKLKEGPATPENVARLLPLPLRPDELVEAMLGGVPTSEFAPRSLAWLDDDREHWLLTLEGNRSSDLVEMVIDPARRRVTSATVKGASSTRMKLSFEGFEEVPGGGEFPRKILFEVPDRDLEVSIKLKELEVNVEISPTLFVLEPPSGLRPEPLDSPPVPVSP